VPSRSPRRTTMSNMRSSLSRWTDTADDLGEPCGQTAESCMREWLSESAVHRPRRQPAVADDSRPCSSVGGMLSHVPPARR
jgi:hypothetical protein